VTIVDDIVELALTPAPTFAEEARLAWLERRLDGQPGRRWRDDVGNLVWAWGDGPTRLLLAAHVDTVFPGDTELRVDRVGDDLVGPGVGDNAAAVAVAVDVVGRLLREGGGLDPGAVVFTVGEEGLGNLRGAHGACELLAPELFIALEGHLLESVLVDAVGSVRARVDVTGPGGHSWSDRHTPSAIHALADLIAAARSAAADDAPVNVGTIEGGRSVNTIADRAAMVVECRSVDPRRLEEFSETLEGLRVPTSLELEVEVLGRRPGGSLPPDSPLVRVALEARRELGLAQVTGAGSTDANAALARGIPAICLGVSYGHGMHSLGERIAVPSLKLGAAQLELVLRRVLGKIATLAQSHI
jgi:tripeptide aminopeptidase